MRLWVRKRFESLGLLRWVGRECQAPVQVPEMKGT